MLPSISSVLPPYTWTFLFENARRISSHDFLPSAADRAIIRKGLTTYLAHHRKGWQLRIYDANFDLSKPLSEMTRFSAVGCVVCSLRVKVDKVTGKPESLEEVLECWKEVTSWGCYGHCGWNLFLMASEELEVYAKASNLSVSTILEGVKGTFEGAFHGRILYAYLFLGNDHSFVEQVLDCIRNTQLMDRI